VRTASGYETQCPGLALSGVRRLRTQEGQEIGIGMALAIPEQEIAIAVSKAEADCTPDDRKLRLLEKQRCKSSFTHFLKYVRIIRPPTRSDPGGLISFLLWPHILDAVRLLLTQRKIVWMKSRQVGASWLIAAYVTWYGLHHVGAKVLLFSKGETEAIELLAKSRIIFEHLPDFMKLKRDPNSLTEIGFPAMSSSIKVLAATKTAGVSFTGSILVCDEWQDHPFAEQNYFAAKPTIDAGGQFIGIYTQSAETLDTLANVVFTEAMEGHNDFAWVFTGWQAVPGRDQAWYDGVKKDIPREKLTFLTPDLFMQRNYPATVEEALLPLKTLAAFNQAVIAEQMANVKNPITVVRDGIDCNIVHIYKDFLIGNYYVAATDTSHGVGSDYSVTVVMNVKTGDIVADILNNIIPPEELAMHSARLLELYMKPLWWIESNDYGGVTIVTAERLGYKNFGYQDEKEKRVGFLTGPHNRPQLWGDLIPAFNNRQITIYNKDGLKQFGDVIRNVETGRIEAMKGRNDDYPMTVGIAWFKKGDVITGDMEYKPLSTLHFGSKLKHRRY
jgi:hypothetical protein